MFTGKTALVTGAGAGIGRALVLELVAKKANVWAVDLDGEALAALKADAAKLGEAIQCRVADVTDVDAMTAIAAEVVQTENALDLWVNNAGIARLGDFTAIDDADFARVIEVNLLAVVTCTRIALERMEPRGTGAIVNLASMAGQIPAPYMSSYVAAKHGVVGFTRSLQAELRLKESPVALTLVCPGFVDTALIEKGKEGGYPAWLSFLLATPDSVAREILDGVAAKHSEIYPTWNGRMMRRLHRSFPKTTEASSKLLLSKGIKDFLVNRPRLL